MTSIATSLLTLTSLKEFRDTVSDSLHCEHRIVVRDLSGKEGLYLMAQAENEVYILRVTGLECPDDVVRTMVCRRSGESDGYEWCRIQGGPSHEKIAHYIDNDISVWNCL